MFFRKTKLLMILAVCLLSVFTVAQGKNYPRNLDKVDTELHPWGGDDNNNPEDLDTSPDLAPPVLFISKSQGGILVSLWEVMVFKIERIYLDYTRTGATSTTIGGSDGPTTGNTSQSSGG